MDRLGGIIPQMSWLRPSLVGESPAIVGRAYKRVFKFLSARVPNDRANCWNRNCPVWLSCGDLAFYEESIHDPICSPMANPAEACFLADTPSWSICLRHKVYLRQPGKG